MKKSIRLFVSVVITLLVSTGCVSNPQTPCETIYLFNAQNSGTAIELGVLKERILEKIDRMHGAKPPFPANAFFLAITYQKEELGPDYEDVESIWLIPNYGQTGANPQCEKDLVSSNIVCGRALDEVMTVAVTYRDTTRGTPLVLSYEKKTQVLANFVGSKVICRNH